MEINEEKRQKFMEMAGKRVNNILHDIEILMPMSKSNNYDFTKEDVEQMFTAIEEETATVKAEFYKKFEEKELKTKKTFSFGLNSTSSETSNDTLIEANKEENE